MKKLLFLLLLVSCSNPSNDLQPDPNSGNSSTPSTPGSTTLGNGQPGIVGLAGIDAWDKLSGSERDRIKRWNTLFLHQSVGQDLEEGAKANGSPFEYFGAQDRADKGSEGRGLRGGIFVDVGGISNGNPYEKIRIFTEVALRSKTTLNIAVFKFGYADVLDTNRDQVKTAYKTFMDELRKQIPGLRFVHITPPLVYSTSAEEGNAAKANVGQWMKDTFKGTDVIFDLQAIETNEGTCQQANVPRICQENRASATDPSEVNGVDSDGQGHLGKKASQRISKALLYAIYQAGR
ncbi:MULTISPECIES: hypothetical protein [unclassified Spirosoma]|uniref:hypothetical protein n=1 Tax=unclassified Spirosoma TaxID=2621999 RepID=UPI000967B549|nr:MULTISPECIES: hypothetical protein [unclassified Spirosoma]MBN8825193.1 hypothetical protein [Spirosoma sp.]OJW77127.1 MAG: hypothetical protein BGO59_31160 [Spirosoma sp. 48-14]